MFEIDQEFAILITREESGFDRACDAAFRMAIGQLGIDDDGHTNRVKGWCRSECWVEVIFVSYSRSSQTHLYSFNAAARKNAEEPISFE